MTTIPGGHDEISRHSFRSNFIHEFIRVNRFIVSFVAVLVSQMKRSRFVPDGFVLTTEQKAWALEQAPWLNIEAEEAKWRDYEYKRLYSDWNKVWRNWIRQAIKYNPRPAGTKEFETNSDIPRMENEEGKAGVATLRRMLR